MASQRCVLGETTYGDQANPSLLPRTAAQRRADAFTAMVHAAAAAGTGDGRTIEATVNGEGAFAALAADAPSPVDRLTVSRLRRRNAHVLTLRQGEVAVLNVDR